MVKLRIIFLNFFGLLIVKFCILLIILGYVVKHIFFVMSCVKKFLKATSLKKSLICTRTQLQECLNGIVYENNKLKTPQISNNSNMINKLWISYVMEYCTEIKVKEPCALVMKWNTQ